MQKTQEKICRDLQGRISGIRGAMGYPRDPQIAAKIGISPRTLYYILKTGEAKKKTLWLIERAERDLGLRPAVKVPSVVASPVAAGNSSARGRVSSKSTAGEDTLEALLSRLEVLLIEVLERLPEARRK